LTSNIDCWYPHYYWNFFAPLTSAFSELIVFTDCCHLADTDIKLMKPCGRILQAAALAAGIVLLAQVSES